MKRRLLFFSLLCGLALLANRPGFSGEAAKREAVHILESDQLWVEVMDPNAEDRYYAGVRFSPVANVLRVAMEGRHFLFAPSEHDPLKHNGGLAMEFDLFPTKDGPPGFLEAAVGESFLKIGVGVLRKEGDTYKVSTPYEVVELAATTADWSQDKAVFRQVSPAVRGLAYALDSEVRVVGNKVLVKHRLTNIGTRPFTTENYAHNFFQFDGRGAGPGYEVEVPGVFELNIQKPVMEHQKNTLVFTGEITRKMKAANAFFTPLEGEPLSGSSVVRNRDLGMAIEAEVSVAPSRVTLHANWDYLCPEQFIDLKLESGASVEWERTYTFHLDSHPINSDVK